MHISYAEFQALLDRIAGLEKRIAQTEKDLLANEKEFELIVQVKEDMYDRIVGLENKVFPRLGEALRQVTRVIGKTDSKPYNPLDFPTKKKPKK